MAKLEQPLAECKAYVQAEAKDLVAKTTEFTAAVKAGNIAKAKSLFAATRYHYERIEPIAELFNELDPAIDAREDDFKQGPKDPAFTGFHRIEYALSVENSTAGVNEIADKLLADVKTLQTRNRLAVRSRPIKWWAARRCWWKKWPAAKSAAKKTATATPI